MCLYDITKKVEPNSVESRGFGYKVMTRETPDSWLFPILTRKPSVKLGDKLTARECILSTDIVNKLKEVDREKEYYYSGFHIFPYYPAAKIWKISQGPFCENFMSIIKVAYTEATVVGRQIVSGIAEEWGGPCLVSCVVARRIKFLEEVK